MNKYLMNKKGLQPLFVTDFILAGLLIAGSLLMIILLTNSNLSKAEDILSMPRDASINLQQLELFVQTPLEINEDIKPVYVWLNEYFKLDFSTNPDDVVLKLSIKKSLQLKAQEFLSRDSGQTFIVSVFKDGVVYRDIPLLDLSHYNHGDYAHSTQETGFSGIYHLQLPAYFNQLLEEPDTYEIVVSLAYARVGFRDGLRLDSLYDEDGYSKQGSIA